MPDQPTTGSSRHLGFRRWLVAPILLGGAAIGVAAGGVVPGVVEARQHVAARDVALAAADDLAVEVGRLEETAEDAPRLAVADAAADLAVPATPDIATFVDHVTAVADTADVTVDAVDSVAVTDARLRQALEVDAVTADAVSVTVSGTRVGVLQAVALLDDPAVTPRTVVWRDVTVTVDDGTTHATLVGWILSTT